MSSFSNFPNLITSGGIPVIGSGPQIPVTLGNYYFANSAHANASDSNEGTHPVDQPMATIDAAVGLCTPNQGDVIIVAAGHAENISLATSLVVDVAGVQIIGLGQGRNRPVLTYTATAGSIEMDAANTRLSNVELLASVSGVVVGINVDAADVELDHLGFAYDETGDDFVTMIDTDAVSRFSIHDCECIAEEVAGCAEAIRLDTATNARIARNYFTGDYTDAVIVGEGALSIGIDIADNTMHNSDVTAGKCVDLNVACTGIISGNRMATAYAGAEDDVFDPGSCQSIENYVSGGTDRNAVPVPVVGIAPWRVVVHRSSVFAGGSADLHGNDGGALDPYSIFTVTGDVEAKVVGIVNTTLTGATATIEVGVVGNTAQFIAQATGTDLDDGDVYTDAGAEAGADVWPEEAQIINDGADIIETVATSDITAGQIDYYCLWRSLEAGASVVSA